MTQTSVLDSALNRKAHGQMATRSCVMEQGREPIAPMDMSVWFLEEVPSERNVALGAQGR